MQYSNPRLVASFPDWPSGAHRVACIFKIEHTPKRGYRVNRTTQNKRGEWCKPKVTTYGGRAVIVDGDDGRTYIVQSAGTYGFIRVMRSDFMDHETVWPDRSPEHYAALLALIEQGNTLIVCPSCGASGVSTAYPPNAVSGCHECQNCGYEGTDDQAAWNAKFAA